MSWELDVLREHRTEVFWVWGRCRDQDFSFARRARRRETPLS